MNTKNLLLSLILLSLAVLVGGGVLYYIQLKKLQETYMRVSYGTDFVPHRSSPVASQTNLKSVGKAPKAAKSSAAAEPFLPAEQPVSNIHPSGYSARFGGSSRQVGSGTGGFGTGTESRIVSGGSGADLLAFGSGGRRSAGGSARNDEGGGVSPSTAGGFMATPPSPLSSNNFVIIDPGGDPTHFIPVGDGLYVLLLLLAVYLAVKREKW